MHDEIGRTGYEAAVNIYMDIKETYLKYQHRLICASNKEETKEINSLIESAISELSTPFLEWTVDGNNWISLHNESIHKLNEMEVSHA